MKRIHKDQSHLPAQYRDRKSDETPLDVLSDIIDNVVAILRESNDDAWQEKARRQINPLLVVEDESICARNDDRDDFEPDYYNVTPEGRF